MQLRKSERRQAKIKLAIQGPSGSGKTYSALLTAFGLCDEWSKIAVIDTENHSSDLYAHLGDFNVLALEPPFAPEKYIEAIRLCVKERMEVVIIDSISHEWDGSGGILEQHSAMAGNSFTNWAKLTPRHNAFVQEILQAPVHLIATIRSKQDYVLTDKNGKIVPEKVGLKAVTREGMDYEFTLVFDLDARNNATASKDRTGLFFGKPDQKLSPATGKQILDWCNAGTVESPNEVHERIGECRSINELLTLYHAYPQYQAVLQKEYEQRKRQLIINQEVQKNLNSPTTLVSNGSPNR